MGAADMLLVGVSVGAPVGDTEGHAVGTAVVGDDVYMLHKVTLGSSGKSTDHAKRHPTVGNGCSIGAGATILGDITVGAQTTVGGAAVVTRSVPARSTVVGVNRIVGTEPKSRL